LGAKFLDVEEVKRVIDLWLTTEFERGRHERRVNKISELEK